MFVVFILGFCLFALAQDLKNKPLKNTIMTTTEIRQQLENFCKMFNLGELKNWIGPIESKTEGFKKVDFETTKETGLTWLFPS